MAPNAAPQSPRPRPGQEVTEAVPVVLPMQWKPTVRAGTFTPMAKVSVANSTWGSFPPFFPPVFASFPPHWDMEDTAPWPRTLPHSPPGPAPGRRSRKLFPSCCRCSGSRRFVPARSPPWRRSRWRTAPGAVSRPFSLPFSPLSHPTGTWRTRHHGPERCPTVPPAPPRAGGHGSCSRRVADAVEADGSCRHVHPHGEGLGGEQHLGQVEPLENGPQSGSANQSASKTPPANHCVPKTTPDQSEVASVMTPHWSGLELPVQRGCFGAGGTCPALAMGRVAAAGAVLVALVVLGAPPAAGEKLSTVLQEMFKAECHFINGTEKVRYMQRLFYNRQQDVMYDSDVGHYVGFTPYGEKVARAWNSNPEWMEERRTAVDWYCRHNYEVSTPFSVERRVPPSVSISLVPSSSQPSPGRLLCSVMDFYPAEIQVRWFQGQQELSGHVVATDIVPNGDWTYQLLVLLEIPPQRGLSYTCQVEHVSLEQPLSLHWEMPPDAARSKMLTGIGGFVLGFVFLALGLGFYLRKKSS
ncbi:uncharacterized protein LOC125320886 isoform X1 [Corvus hawaiiensis]|uniref:uncharacterized protein LOC125320886 isoform X1 n=1 Tax=Corvus hawaiiensis TaxID=134902 RepID=UPI0020193CB8|nr:uncharacterized protein LOC125320886 isoform X1 [Corvus hawaiiensis]